MEKSYDELMDMGGRITGYKLYLVIYVMILEVLATGLKEMLQCPG
jgi:hypothetical protein